jgi:hypothetical protein
MYKLETVPINLIDPNQHRDLATYPWLEHKVGHLMASMQEVGFWAGVIARRVGDRYELAFGHHRLEAARRLKITKIPLLLADLTDLQMLQYMGRENGEDYNTEFLVMMNTWEGGVNFLANSKGYASNCGTPQFVKQPTEIAKVLGWTRVEGGSVRMSEVAVACSAAYKLIADGHMARADLTGLSVGAARDILTRAQARINQLEEIGKREGHPHAETKKLQKIVGKAAKITARDVRAGGATKGLRDQVDLNALRAANKEKVKHAPLFTLYGKALCDSIDRMLKDDSVAEKIDRVVEALPDIEFEADHALIRRLRHELDELSRRASRAMVRVTPNKVVKLKEITKE